MVFRVFPWGAWRFSLFRVTLWKGHQQSKSISKQMKTSAQSNVSTTWECSAGLQFMSIILHRFQRFPLFLVASHAALSIKKKTPTKQRNKKPPTQHKIFSFFSVLDFVLDCGSSPDHTGDRSRGSQGCCPFLSVPTLRGRSCYVCDMDTDMCLWEQSRQGGKEQKEKKGKQKQVKEAKVAKDPPHPGILSAHLTLSGV